MIAYMDKYEHINFIYVFIWKYMGLHILQTKSYIVIYGGICDFIFANGVYYIWAYMEVYVSPYSQKRTIYGQIWKYMEFHMCKKDSYINMYGSIGDFIYPKNNF